MNWLKNNPTLYDHHARGTLLRVVGGKGWTVTRQDDDGGPVVVLGRDRNLDAAKRIAEEHLRRAATLRIGQREETIL